MPESERDFHSFLFLTLNRSCPTGGLAYGMPRNCSKSGARLSPVMNVPAANSTGFVRFGISELLMVVEERRKKKE